MLPLLRSADLSRCIRSPVVLKVDSDIRWINSKAFSWIIFCILFKASNKPRNSLVPMQRRFFFFFFLIDFPTNFHYQMSLTNPSAKPETWSYVLNTFIFSFCYYCPEMRTHTGRCFHYRGKKCCKMMLTINLSAAAGRAPDCSQNELNLIFF